jgi:hypothetical protein
MARNIKANGAKRGHWVAEFRSELSADMQLVYDALPTQELKNALLNSYRVPAPTATAVVDKLPRLLEAADKYEQLRNLLDARINLIRDTIRDLRDERITSSDVNLKTLKGAILVNEVGVIRLQRNGKDEEEDEEENNNTPAESTEKVEETPKKAIKVSRKKA